MRDSCQESTVSDAGNDDNGECIDQLWDCQLLKKDFAANGLIRNIVNPLNAELNPICHLLALLGTHHILHVSRVRVNDNAVVWTNSQAYNRQ